MHLTQEAFFFQYVESLKVKKKDANTLIKVSYTC